MCHVAAEYKLKVKIATDYMSLQDVVVHTKSVLAVHQQQSLHGIYSLGILVPFFPRPAYYYHY